jgi:hypothetical protein
MQKIDQALSKGIVAVWIEPNDVPFVPHSQRGASAPGRAAAAAKGRE